MRKQGRVESYAPTGANGDGGKDVVWVYWRTPEEWAEIVERWVDETAQRGVVLTVYEITEGETCRGTGKLFLHLLFSPSVVFGRPSCGQVANEWSCRVLWAGSGVDDEGSSGPRQEGEGADFWPGGLAGCQVLLRDKT